MRGQARQVEKRAVRRFEPRGIDDESVADLQRVIQLTLAERRRTHPPEVVRNPALQEGVDQAREVVTRRAMNTQRDQLALHRARGLRSHDVGRYLGVDLSATQ